MVGNNTVKLRKSVIVDTDSVIASSDTKEDLCCLICGRQSNGRHYGCVSCVRCKTFFRRAVLQKQEPKCILDDGECKNPMKYCRGCRYRACLQMGMTITALRPKRDIIGVRRCPPSTSAPSKCYSKSAKEKTNKSESSSKELLQLISKLTAFDENIRAKKFELLRLKNEAKELAAALKNDENLVSPPNNRLIITMRSDMSEVTQVEMLMLMEWVKCLPDFLALPMSDQITLLKRFAVHYMVLEHGYFTASVVDVDDLWLISNGTCMPRSVNLLPEQIKRTVTEGRRWRQEKLYKQMTDRCIDEVAVPLRRLKLMPQELLTLKIIMLFNCGNHTHSEDNTLLICDESRQKLIRSKNQIINALFEFYKSINYKNYEERFGNVILTLSGIFSAATALLESYQIMRFFKLCNYDHISEQLLFDASD
ncbi:ligand-binding domain of nuclear hormone receptor domain-containing protein [Ditylenchus destructor]|nr:ligand-binding domain of nuclear hormone receptor domain-containing protein [Ditylenchus destructor]